MENNLFGEVIFTSGNGLPTYGISTVNLEADTTLGAATEIWAGGGAVARTFYARYLDLDQRDGLHQLRIRRPRHRPLDLRSLGRGLRRPARAPRPALGRPLVRPDLLGHHHDQLHACGALPTSFNGNCVIDEPLSTLTFFDEDENTVTQGVCPSPCSTPQFNFPYETQQRNITDFQHPAANAGWVQIDFAGGTSLDQAWVGYAFLGSVALESVLIPATQLDPSSCNPLGITRSPGDRSGHPDDSDGHRSLICFSGMGGAQSPAHFFSNYGKASRLPAV